MDTHKPLDMLSTPMLREAIDLFLKAATVKHLKVLVHKAISASTKTPLTSNSFNNYSINKTQKSWEVLIWVLVLLNSNNTVSHNI